MDQTSGRGNLARTPFARLLAEIWQKEFTGTLVVKTGGEPKSFFFDAGAMALIRAAFPEQAFLRFLLTAGVSDLITLAGIEESARQKGASLVRTMLEASLFEPIRLWSWLDAFARAEAYPVFDLEEAGFEVRPGRLPEGPAYVRNIFLPNLVLEGSRRMTNDAVIAAHLPAGNEPVQSLSPYFLDLLDLTPHERYVLDILSTAQTPAGLWASSDLAERESRRILFAFLCLGVAGTPPAKPKTARLSADLSLADMDRLFGLFNAKCSAVFRYMSKEIGPVALSVIGKSLEDVRGRLDPAFQGFELQPDGRIELKSFLNKMNATLGGDENRKALLRSMDEVLVAEVLAVKRTLGQAHESTLVRSLERIGDSG
jgi:hypothetical protein